MIVDGLVLSRFATLAEADFSPGDQLEKLQPAWTTFRPLSCMSAFRSAAMFASFKL